MNFTSRSTLVASEFAPSASVGWTLSERKNEGGETFFRAETRSVWTRMLRSSLCDGRDSWRSIHPL